MAVALNCGMGSSSLNAEVNAFERLQIVRGRTSSYFGSKFEVEVMHAAGQVFWSFQSALDECLVDDHLGGDVCQFASLPSFHLLSHGFEVPLHSVDADRDAVDQRENDFECFARTGVNTPVLATFEHTNTRYPQIDTKHIGLVGRVGQPY